MMEKIRDKIKSSTPELVDFNITSNGSRAVFNLKDISKHFIWNKLKRMERIVPHLYLYLI